MTSNDDFNFDKHFASIQRTARSGMIVAAIIWFGSMLMGLALTAFTIWAAVHFILKYW